MKMDNKYLFGLLLLFPLVFFGLGVVGLGEDHLTNMLMNIVVSEEASYSVAKAIFGVVMAISVFCITLGHQDMKHGKLIHLER